MFSSGPASANFKGLRRKTQNQNDVGFSNVHMARPSTATSPERPYRHGLTDLLQPARDGPPSPEGIRAFSRQVKTGSMPEQKNNEPPTPSRSTSPDSDDLDPTPWERHPEYSNLSRNPSQRSSGMSLKERHESVQLFSKNVFSRKPKFRRDWSEQVLPSPSLPFSNETPNENFQEQTKEQRFKQMFTRRRPRVPSEASQKKVQISGPYDFQHVHHTKKEQRHGSSSGLSVASSRTATDASTSLLSLDSQSLDKPLPAPPSPHESLRRISLRDGPQFSPPRSPAKFVFNDAHASLMSPIPPPRTSSRMSARHDRAGSFGVANLNQQAQHFILPSAEGIWPRPVSGVSISDSGQDLTTGEEVYSHPVHALENTAWPLTSSMTSLHEVPEEEEYHLASNISHISIMSKRASLRGSVSVPHLRRVSLGRATQRPPSNASDTLGRLDLFAAQRAVHAFKRENMDDVDFMRDSWEDDIDYCYDHAAEADCDFAWERPSCDMEREGFRDEGLLAPVSRLETNGSRLSTDLPGLSPTSYESRLARHEAATPTSSPMPSASNFSLPRIDSSSQLKHDRDRSNSSASSFQEAQGFCLSPSLLIPDDYCEQMLLYGRDGLRSHASTEDLKFLEHDHHQYLKFDKPGAYAHARSSASTTLSTLSETSSRYPSSTFSSSVFTRWTGSSSSSWQHVELSQPLVAITLNDKEAIATTPISVGAAMSTMVSQDTGREGHNRAQSDANLLMKVANVAAVSADSKTTQESLKTHRRARTTSRSHSTTSPQFALFPQLPQRGC